MLEKLLKAFDYFVLDSLREFAWEIKHKYLFWILLAAFLLGFFILGWLAWTFFKPAIPLPF